MKKKKICKVCKEEQTHIHLTNKKTRNHVKTEHNKCKKCRQDNLHGHQTTLTKNETKTVSKKQGIKFILLCIE